MRAALEHAALPELHGRRQISACERASADELPQDAQTRSPPPHHDNLLRILDGREAVGDEQHGTARAHGGEGRLDRRLCPHVEAVEGGGAGVLKAVRSSPPPAAAKAQERTLQSPRRARGWAGCAAARAQWRLAAARLQRGAGHAPRPAHESEPSRIPAPPPRASPRAPSFRGPGAGG